MVIFVGTVTRVLHLTYPSPELRSEVEARVLHATYGFPASRKGSYTDPFFVSSMERKIMMSSALMFAVANFILWAATTS